MRKIVKSAAIIGVCAGILTHCVIKKDTTASAATSAALAKKIAQGIAGGGTGAPASVQPGNPSAATAACTPEITLNGSSAIIACTGGTFEFYQVIANNNTFSGYEKFKDFDIAEGSAAYKLNGQLNLIGSMSLVNIISSTAYTSTYDTTFNGELTVTGADSFSVIYKDYRIKTVSTVNTQTFAQSYTFTCSGALVVDGINFAIQPDCSIAN